MTFLHLKHDSLPAASLTEDGYLSCNNGIISICTIPSLLGIIQWATSLGLSKTTAGIKCQEFIDIQ